MAANHRKQTEEQFFRIDMSSAESWAELQRSYEHEAWRRTAGTATKGDLVLAMHHSLSERVTTTVYNPV